MSLPLFASLVCIAFLVSMYALIKSESDSRSSSDHNKEIPPKGWKG